MLKLIKLFLAGVTLTVGWSGVSVAASELEEIYTTKGYEELCKFTCDGAGYDNFNLLRICKASNKYYEDRIDYIIGGNEETSCAYTNETNVRGMEAWLFDVECSGEGEPYTFRSMLMRSDSGVFEITNGSMQHYIKCN